jgi:UDP-N-acetylglucosamine 2-epimerase
MKAKLNCFVLCGVRPQFVKTEHLLWATRLHPDFLSRVNITVIDTGQHYSLPLKVQIIDDKYINVISIKHASKSPSDIFGSSITQCQKILMKASGVSCVIVFGDANPCVVGAIAASRLDIPVFHFEAGARRDPKEVEHKNSKMVDAISKHCFTVSKTHLQNLYNEGLENRSSCIGDISGPFLKNLLRTKNFSSIKNVSRVGAIFSIHRPQYCKRENIQMMLDIGSEFKENITFICHPRLKNIVKSLVVPKNINMVPSQSYTNMLDLLARVKVLISDSGGLLREAHYFGTHAIAIREFGGWEELIKLGYIIKCSFNYDEIMSAIKKHTSPLKVNIKSTPYCNENTIDNIHIALNRILEDLNYE